jgi:hypothetical protein
MDHGSWRCPTAGDLDPFGHAAALFAFDFHNVRVASATTPDAVLFFRVSLGPIVVFLQPLLLVLQVLLQVRNMGELTGGRIGWTMLDGRVPIAKVSKVVDIGDGEKSTSRQGMDGSITPLLHV